MKSEKMIGDMLTPRLLARYINRENNKFSGARGYALMAKIEVTCSCGQIFIMKENEIKRCPKCGQPHRGPIAPREFTVNMN